MVEIKGWIIKCLEKFNSEFVFYFFFGENLRCKRKILKMLLNSRKMYASIFYIFGVKRRDKSYKYKGKYWYDFIEIRFLV